LKCGKPSGGPPGFPHFNSLCYDDWPSFRPSSGPVFDYQSAGSRTKLALFSIIKWPSFHLTKTHRKLDAAVFDAYGWPHDLSDEEILERLLALNLERAGVTAQE